MYYVLKRNDQYQIIFVSSAVGDPLYGQGSWDMFIGPFGTWDEAEEAWAEAIAAQPLMNVCGQLDDDGYYD